MDFKGMVGKLHEDAVRSHYKEYITNEKNDNDKEILFYFETENTAEVARFTHCWLIQAALIYQNSSNEYLLKTKVDKECQDFVVSKVIADQLTELVNQPREHVSEKSIGFDGYHCAFVPKDENVYLWWTFTPIEWKSLEDAMSIILEYYPKYVKKYYQRALGIQESV